MLLCSALSEMLVFAPLFALFSDLIVVGRIFSVFNLNQLNPVDVK
jgi:hypothetical protein